MPVVIGWFSTNLAGHLRRGVGTAFFVAFGNVGGIIASYTYPAADAPHYKTGHAVCIAFIGLSVLASTAYFCALRWENANRAARVTKGEKGDLNDRQRDLRGDMNLEYRYLL
jgi:hypothetical protein